MIQYSITRALPTEGKMPIDSLDKYTALSDALKSQGFEDIIKQNKVPTIENFVIWKSGYFWIQEGHYEYNASMLQECLFDRHFRSDLRLSYLFEPINYWQEYQF